MVYKSSTGGSSGGSGNVVGPSSATDNGIALFDGVTGKLLKSPADITYDGSTLAIGGASNLGITSTLNGSLINVAATPTATSGATAALNFLMNTGGLTSAAGWRGLAINTSGTDAAGSSFYALLQRSNTTVWSMSAGAAGGEIAHTPTGFTGFGSYVYNGVNTSGYGFLRGTNLQTGILMRNALPTDDGTGIGFRLGVTTNTAYAPVTNTAAKILQLWNGHAIGSGSAVETHWFKASGDAAFLGKTFLGGVGTTPTALVHLAAGTTAASTAPFKYTSGTLLTTAEAGAKEFLTDKEYLTITTGAVRKELALVDPSGGLTSGRIPYVTTNGRLTDAANLTYDGSNTLTLGSATTAQTAQAAAMKASYGNTIIYSGVSTVASAGNAGAFTGLYCDDGAALASGDRCGGFLLGGSTSASTLANATLIAAFASEAWSGTVNGADLAFETTANGGNSRTEKWRIKNNGALLATTDNSYSIGADGATRPANVYVGTLVKSSTYQSTVATGTAPFVVASTTQVANLNAATAGAVTNATLTTALTVNTGTLTLTANAANTSVLTIGAGAVSVSGANTGDQTITLTGAVTGTGVGSFATTIATPGTLTVASTNSTATAHTHAITSSSAPGAAASLLATDSSGIIGSTGTRIVKGWFTDLTVTNAIAGSVTGNAATVTTNANLTGSIVTSTGNATTVNMSPITNSLSGTVALNNTANFFDGPSVAQGTSGTWFVSGTVTCFDSTASAGFVAKLWDGTTVIASTIATSTAANNAICIALSGYIASPAANLKISVKDLTSTSGVIGFNGSGAGKDSTITAIRIA